VVPKNLQIIDLNQLISIMWHSELQVNTLSIVFPYKHEQA